MTIRFTIPRFRPLFIFTLVSVMLGSGAAISGDSELDMDGVLHLMGRHSIAHACPVDTDAALTAAHVTDPRWFDPDFDLIPYRFENDRGTSGLAKPAGIYSDADLGWLKLQPGIVKPYKISDTRPQPDDNVYWIEYNFKKKKDAFRIERRDAKILRTLAGHILINEAPTQGASGGCLFNASNEVVGIVTASWLIGNRYKPNVGMSVGIWGKWMPKKPKAFEEEKDDDSSADDVSDTEL